MMLHQLKHRDGRKHRSHRPEAKTRPRGVCRPIREIRHPKPALEQNALVPCDEDRAREPSSRGLGVKLGVECAQRIALAQSRDGKIGRRRRVEKLDIGEMIGVP